MGLKTQFTKTPYLVLFVILISIGVGTASALITITFEGLTIFKENAQFDKDVNIDGAITGVETLEGINCSTEQIARFDGSNWVCGKLKVKINPNTIVDNGFDVGYFTSIAIGLDGNPVISHYDFSNEHLKVAHCGNPSCSEGNVITTVDNTDGVGGFSSIAIGSDDNPVISYYDSTNGNLKVAHCGNPSCSAGNVISTLEDIGVDSGRYSSIAIGLDDNPVISYHDTTNGQLKFVQCGNPSCSSVNVQFALEPFSSDVIGHDTSIAIGTDGNPVISYLDSTNGLLKVVACGVPACNDGLNPNVFTTIDNVSGEAGSDTSISIGVDDKPVISYRDGINHDLKVAHCNNTSCSDGSVKTILDSNGFVGLHSSIAIGSNGNPVISYFDSAGSSLKLVQCGNLLCSASNTISVIDSENHSGFHTSIAIGMDGNPIISYQGNNDLKVAVIAPVIIFE